MDGKAPKLVEFADSAQDFFGIHIFTYRRETIGKEEKGVAGALHFGTRRLGHRFADLFISQTQSNNEGPPSIGAAVF